MSVQEIVTEVRCCRTLQTLSGETPFRTSFSALQSQPLPMRNAISMLRDATQDTAGQAPQPLPADNQTPSSQPSTPPADSIQSSQSPGGRVCDREASFYHCLELRVRESRRMFHDRNSSLVDRGSSLASPVLDLFKNCGEEWAYRWNF